MPLKLKLNAFSISDMNNAKQKVMAYRHGLIRKCDIFVRKLANKGILVAQEHLGDADEGYGKYITFGLDLEHGQYGCKGLMYATNTGIIKSQWKTVDDNGNEVVREEDVSPLLMVEFGAGLRAERSSNAWASKFGMGTGTFPNQTHAFDPEGWWYKGMDDEWHHSYGVYASMPVYHAMMEMMDEIHNTAMEVFGS